MTYFLFRNVTFISVCFILFSCSISKNTLPSAAAVKHLNFLGGYEIPFNFNYKNTIVGGLSGIDYDKKHNRYYLISDDRSERNAARFYTALVFVNESGIDSMTFIDVKNMLQPDGQVFPGTDRNRYKTPDPESIRYNPKTGMLIWSSEGERIVKQNDTVLIHPSIVIMNTEGKHLDSFALPDNFKMQAIQKGPRRNGVFEGMSYADHYRTLYVSVEEPLYEDGPKADITDNNASIRIIKFDVASRKSIAQYAYKLEPVAFAATPENEFKINGVSEILSLGNNKLLVVERSFSTGRLPSTIKLFVAELAGATDVSSFSLRTKQSFKAIKKTLLLNMDDLGIYTDNIEGVCFGPLLPNGNKTLLFIADNNFNDFEKAQLLLFEVVE